MGKALGWVEKVRKTEAALDSLRRGPPSAPQPERAGVAAAGPVFRVEICWLPRRNGVVLPRPPSARASEPACPKGACREIGVAKQCGALVLWI